MAAAAACARGWADPPPLVVRGELKETDPLDRVQKQSRANVHEVELKAGQAMLVGLRSIDFDPMLRVEDAKGTVLGQNDDIVRGTLTNSRLGFVAPQAGTYRLVVTSFHPDWTGEYLLEVAPLEPIGEPEATDGALTDKAPTAQGKRFQLHKVTAEAGRWYLLDVASKDFEALLVLRDGQGRALASDQGGGEGRNARLVWPAGAGQPWQLQVVAMQAGTGGRYALRVASYRGELKAAATAREKLDEQARLLNARGLAAHAAGRFADAQELMRQTLLLRQQLYPTAKYPRGHHDLAESLTNVGGLLQLTGQYEAARAYYDQALTMFRRLYPQGHPALAIGLCNRGVLLGWVGQYEAARADHEQALAMCRNLYPETQYPQGHPVLAQSLNGWARCWRRWASMTRHATTSTRRWRCDRNSTRLRSTRRDTPTWPEA